MQARIPVLALTVLIPLAADQITLKNGDRITGKIVKKEGPALTVKSDLLGDVTVKWANVSGVVTTQPVVVVVPDGEPVRGTVATSGGELQVAGDAGMQRVPLSQVDVMRGAAEQAKYERYLHPPLTDLWSGFLDLGLATAQGNARTLTSANAFSATRVTRNDKISIRATHIYSRGYVNGTVTETAKAVRGGWTYNRNLSSRLFINTFNDYENDAFQNLKLRVVAGGGLGWSVWKRETSQFDVLAGGSYDHDQFGRPLLPKEPGLAPQFSRQAGEAYWGDDLLLTIGPRSTLKQAFRLFDNLTATGEHRMNFDLGTDTKLNKWLAWQITASDRYLTNPAPGRKTNDLLISTGIRLSFAR